MVSMNPISSPLQPVKEPGYSGFDKSFKNLLTAKPGTLIPVLCDPLIPGSRVNLGDALTCKLPPLASDTFMNVDLKLEAFFVPAQACYGGFNDWITKRKINRSLRGAQGASPKYTESILPYMTSYDLGNALINDNAAFDFTNKVGTLTDYLNFHVSTSTWPVDANNKPLPGPNVNIMPFLAYHRIWDCFYRNKLIQNPAFSPYDFMASIDQNANNGDNGSISAGVGYRSTAGNLPYLTFTKKDQALYSDAGRLLYNNYGSFYDADNDEFDENPGCVMPFLMDGLSLFALRQRNYGADYFNTATPSAQYGAASEIGIDVDSVTHEGAISIQAIRAANSLQIFRERNNYVGDDIRAYNRLHFGVKRSSFCECKPSFLGQQIVNVYTNGVSETSAYGNGSRNPFAGALGAQGGISSGSDRGQLVSNFETDCYGYLMVLASLVPKPAYSHTTDRHFVDLVNDGVGDIPDAILQNVGPQDIYPFELGDLLGTSFSSGSPDGWKGGFGYQQRFAHYMDKVDQVHGLFLKGQSLDAFALQRRITAASLGSSFLEIPVSALDGVAAASGWISGYGYQLDIFFDYKVSMPLAAYSIPSLENPDGSTDWVARPGYTI